MVVIVQLVEHQIVVLVVVGSSPTGHPNCLVVKGGSEEVDGWLSASSFFVQSRFLSFVSVAFCLLGVDYLLWFVCR